MLTVFVFTHGVKVSLLPVANDINILQKILFQN
jgi:hypothetical protein